MEIHQAKGEPVKVGSQGGELTLKARFPWDKWVVWSYFELGLLAHTNKYIPSVECEPQDFCMFFAC